MAEPADVVIYHNPECGTSRNVLGLIRKSGIEPQVVEYLRTPLNRSQLQDLVAFVGRPVRDLMRERGTPSSELAFGVAVQDGGRPLRCDRRASDSVEQADRDH